MALDPLSAVLGELDPGQLDSGQLGPGQLGPGVQLSGPDRPRPNLPRAHWITTGFWQIGPQGPTVRSPICLEPLAWPAQNPFIQSLMISNTPQGLKVSQPEAT